MKRGLYVRAGDCATARLAACAISLFGPTTNDSKVLRGLSPSALPVRLLSRLDSTMESSILAGFRMTSSSPVALPAGDKNFTVRGPPQVVTIAACSAGI